MYRTGAEVFVGMVHPVMERYDLVFGILLVALLVFAAPAAAVPVVVIDNSSANAIATNLSSVDPGGVLILNPGTYFEHGIVINQHITIRANASLGGTPADTIIDAEHSGSIFSVSSGQDLIIDSLALQNGQSTTGGAILNAGTVTITSSSITGCTATTDGGAIWSGGDVTVQDSEISGCTAANNGGAIYLDSGGRLTVHDAGFESDTATNGGGGAIFVATGSTATIDDGTSFTGCRAGTFGGAIKSTGTVDIADTTFTSCSAKGGGAIRNGEFPNPGTLAIASSTFTDCSATAGFLAEGGGGAVYNTFRSTATITGSTFSGCTAVSHGGAIINDYYGTTTITASAFDSCTAGRSGGAIISSDWSTATITSSTFSGCTAGLGGGTISYASSGPMIIDSSRITGSQAPEGGAIMSYYGSNLTIRNGSAILSSTATTDGGAISISRGNVTVQDSAISLCDALNNGGAISLLSGGNLTVRNATFLSVAAHGEGGAIAAATGSTVTIDDGTSFTGCTATTFGGAIKSTGTVDIADTTFTSCSARGGGAIWNGEYPNPGTLTITSSTFNRCAATAGFLQEGGGGAVYNSYLSTAAITGSTFRGCTATTDGGAIINDYSGTMTIGSSAFSNCTAGRGGGAIVNTGGSTGTISSSTFTGCTADAGGGTIIYSSSGPMIIDSSRITGSQALQGGAIWTNGGDNLTIRNGSAISSSTATTDGGGICLFDSNITVQDSAISQCTAADNGGAIYLNGRSSLTMITSTLTSCVAGNGGAIHGNGGRIPSITFSRFFNNTAPTGPEISLTSVTVSSFPENWWGANSDPSGKFAGVSGPSAYTPWLVLNGSASPSSITTAQTALVRINLTNTSAGADTASGGIFVPGGIPVAYALSGVPGTLEPSWGNVSAGSNTTTFRPAGAGTAVITATVDGESVPVTVIVVHDPPVVTSITPPGGMNTSPVTITNLAGTGFWTPGTTTVNLSRAGYPNITATGVTVAGSTQITCTLPITGAEAGTWDVVVTNPDRQEGVLANGFTITAPPPPPAVTSITPPGGINTSPVTITNLEGTGFWTSGTTTVNLTRAGHGNITTTTTALSSTQIACSLPITGTEAGTWDVVITNPDGQEGVLANGFTITAPAPTTIPVTTTTTAPVTTTTTGPVTTTTTVPVTTPTFVPTTTTTTNPYSGSSSTGSGSDDGYRGTSETLPLMTVTVNIGGDAKAYRATVTGMKLADLVITGTVQHGAGDNVTAPPGIVFQYFRLEPAAYGSITRAIINFTVPQSWLEENHIGPKSIVLYHYTANGWEVLPTTYLHARDGTAYFSAVSPGFSLFAITGTPGAAAPAVSAAAPQEIVTEAMQPPVAAAVPKAPTAAQATPPTATTTKASGPSPLASIMLVIAAIGIIAWGGFMARR